MTTTVTVHSSGNRTLVETFDPGTVTDKGMKCLSSVILPPSTDAHQFQVSGSTVISVCEAGDDVKARTIGEVTDPQGNVLVPGTGTVNQIGDTAPQMPAMPEPGSADDKADMGNLDAGKPAE